MSDYYRDAWYDDGRNAVYWDGRDAYEWRDAYYVDERNAAFGDEWRNDYYRTVYNPRTRRYERQLVRTAPRPPAPSPVAMVPYTPRPMPTPTPTPTPATPAVAAGAVAMPANVACGPSAFKNEFGQVRTGLIIDAIAQSLAAFAPLPAAPAPTGQMDLDQANSITYLAALAGHAKRDEQVRTVSKLVQLFVRS
jgi:hypothetical protein